VVALLVTKTGIGQHNMSGQGGEEDTVITVAGMLLRGGWAVDDTTRGGGRRCKGLLLVQRP
jgi:hypothetical protein